MSIATATPQGMPSLRTVLLWYYDDRGYVFFTNYTSRKAQEIEANPEMCMLLPWVTPERQIIVYGRAEKIFTRGDAQVFLELSAITQLGAWVSHQSQVISTRKLLMMKLAELKHKFAEGKVPLPDFWGGYRIVPHHMESPGVGVAPGRVHDRFMYTSRADGSGASSACNPDLFAQGPVCLDGIQVVPYLVFQDEVAKLCGAVE